MPTYQYKRKDGTTFEILQRITDEALKTCPKTGQPVERIVTGGGGVIYKGSGWYVTDYKNKSNGGSSPSTSTSANPDSNESGSKDQGSESTSSNGNSGTASSTADGAVNGKNGTTKSATNKN